MLVLAIRDSDETQETLTALGLDVPSLGSHEARGSSIMAIILYLTVARCNESALEQRSGRTELPSEAQC